MNALWIGNKLGWMELLTLKSFAAHGHKVHLWVYDDLDTPIPAGTELKDATEILPRDKVFFYPQDGPLAWTKGSPSGFSDVFRYKLLSERGGWWIDMDVTCLKPFDMQEKYFFRNHWKLMVVGNVMKCPKGSPMIQKAFELAEAQVGADNDDWHKPIEILNQQIEAFDLMNYRRLGLFNPDQAEMLKVYYDVNSPFPHDWYGVHWCQTSGGFEIIKDSRVYLLLEQHDLLHAAGF